MAVREKTGFTGRKKSGTIKVMISGLSGLLQEELPMLSITGELPLITAAWITVTEKVSFLCGV